MKNEVRIFFTALMFYTRIPCPKWVDHSAEYINKSTRYFPLIGWIVGGIAFLFLYSGNFLFGVPIAIILSMIASVLTTGAFHEDGFADMCDGFGGGWAKEQILDIMKDSRLGTYGAIGLLLILLLKFFLTLQLIDFFETEWLLIVLIIISSHSLSRFVASTFIVSHDYVQDADNSKVKPVAKSLKTRDVLIGAVWGFIPFVGLIYFLEIWYVAFAIVPLFLGKAYLGRFFKKWIGGYTGDCLGATQQVTEVLFLASILGLWTFI